MKPALTKQAVHDLAKIRQEIIHMELDIQSADGKSRSAFQDSVTRRIEQGQHLLLAKEVCPHGEWELWCEGLKPIMSKTTIERRMNDARNPSRLTGPRAQNEVLALNCDGENGENGRKEERSLVPYLQALDRVSKLCGFIERQRPKDAPEMLGWIPEEGKEKLRQDLEPVVKELWPGRIG
jgi:hypothetical protein